MFLKCKKLVFPLLVLCFVQINYLAKAESQDDFFNADGAGSVSTFEKNKPSHDAQINSLKDEEAKKIWQNNYLFLLQQSHNFDVNFPDVKNVGLEFQHAQISLNYDKKYTTNMSESNLKPDNCIVNFYFGSQDHEMILPNEKENLTFMYLHELGHCLLSDKVFTQGIPWTKTIKEQIGEENARKMNQELTFASLNEIKNHHQNTAHIYDALDDRLTSNTKIIPLVVYHEMFADTQAMIWIAKMYPQDFTQILNGVIKFRKAQYVELKAKNISYDHPTFFSLEVLKQYIEAHPQEIYHYNSLQAKNLALTATQIGFLNYLKEEK